MEILKYENGDNITIHKNGKVYELHRKFLNLEDHEVNTLLNVSGRLQKLNHPNISILKSVIKTNNDYTIIEEIQTNTNLLDLITKNTKLQLSTIKWLSDGLLDALDTLHPTLLHGNLRPELIWVDIPSRTIKISCIGIFQENLPYQYASPEYLLDSKLTEQSDIYSLGAVLYYALTGTQLPNALEVKQGLANIQPPRDMVGLEAQWNKFILDCIQLPLSKRFKNIKNIKAYLGAHPKDVWQKPQRLVSAESITKKKQPLKNE